MSFTYMNVFNRGLQPQLNFHRSLVAPSCCANLAVVERDGKGKEFHNLDCISAPRWCQTTIKAAIKHREYLHSYVWTALHAMAEVLGAEQWQLQWSTLKAEGVYPSSGNWRVCILRGGMRTGSGICASWMIVRRFTASWLLTCDFLIVFMEQPEVMKATETNRDPSLYRYVIADLGMEAEFL